MLTPIRMFLRGCRKSLFRLKAADSTGSSLTGGRLLAAAIVMRRLLRREGVVSSDQRMVGVLLPPSVGAVLANVAIGLNGKVAVNLNYTFSSEGVGRCIEQCAITHVLTSRRFLKRRPIELDAQIVCLEDLKERANWKDRVIGALGAYALPAFVLERVLRLTKIKPDDLMAVLFTSGTTGDPKGVMLSHQNIASSISAIDILYRVDPEDVVLGILPFFHAFGFSATLWLPLTLDMAAVYHFDPFGTKAISALSKKYRVTLLFATPTFLKLYLRRCDEQDLADLDLAIVGAEKLDPELATKFAEKFHATPIEGYGATELSPWASVNVPPHRSRAKGVVENRIGTVGRPLPGVQVKIVDPESGQELATGNAGLLLVRGPNVMLGYLNQPAKTAEVVRDGWYDTGDYAMLDSSGFVTITGRQSRFSKIGGEIVPHAKLERTITEIVCKDGASSDQPQVAVTAIDDAKKGERLVVIHEPLGDLTASGITSQLANMGLPHLWIPKPADFIEVPCLPVTSIGKVDLGALKRIAGERKASTHANSGGDR